jgi:deoxyribodipyrimidine photo-lyase
VAKERSIWWVRRDLRLQDNPALEGALARGDVVALYIHAPDEEAPWSPGAASQAWLRRSLCALAADLRERGARLILRRGPSLDTLREVAGATGASSIHWNRLYEPALVARDTSIRQALREQGLDARSYNGALWLDPWELRTGSGTPYRVFTPYWRQLRARLETVAAPTPTPAQLRSSAPPSSLHLRELLSAPVPRWDRGFWREWVPGESGAHRLLDAFIEGALQGYREQRDRPDRIGTSRLSPHLHFGEISPRTILWRLRESHGAALQPEIEGYLRELGWREFSHHLLFHFPASTDENLNPRFERFDWNGGDEPALQAWREGRTGMPIVDAGMRELWHTGWMHNRVRMIVASFLTKNLRRHWLDGARWFWDTLVDADLANNTQGWQWTAGTGADAAPYFRVFNPVTQARKFDPHGHYLRRWLPELAGLPDVVLFEPWLHPELLASHAPDYPRTPVVDLRRSREAALQAYATLRA